MLCLCLTAAFFCISEPVVNMREQPGVDFPVVSQTYFSEEVKVNKKNGDWVLVSTPDNYEGWIKAESLVTLSEPYEGELKTSRLMAHLYAKKDTEYGPIKTIPYGSKLRSIDATDARWIHVVLPDDSECYIQKGDVAEEPKLMHKKDLIAFSQKFLNLPYTWGGRSSFGFDCSGFVQMLYRQIGIHLQRDARQQIKDSRFKEIPLDQLEKGDLIFFGKSATQILHVAMFIGNGQFIHASVRENKPWIRVSDLSDFEWNGNEKAYYPFRTARQLVGE